MKKVSIYQVDAFTGKAFAGNPAGVVPEAEGLGDEEMQLIAREMDLSETAFVTRSRDAGADFDVRFFTPVTEVDLCGHATIATFHLLAELGRVRLGGGRTKVRQRTGAGILPVEILRPKGSGGVPENPTVMMTLALPAMIDTLEGEDEVADLLGIQSLNIKDAPGEMQIISAGLPILIVGVMDLASLEALAPKMDRLADYSRRHDIVGVYAFTLETRDKEATAHARFFAPAAGISEEAATGTAAGGLGAYLVTNQLAQVPETDQQVRLLIEQGHIMGRPSCIVCEVTRRDGGIQEVRVGGRAVTVLEGILKL